jgi:hypothetical protein
MDMTAQLAVRGATIVAIQALAFLLIACLVTLLRHGGAPAVPAHDLCPRYRRLGSQPAGDGSKDERLLIAYPPSDGFGNDGNAGMTPAVGPVGR